jgi:hypothetical protein
MFRWILKALEGGSKAARRISNVVESGARAISSGLEMGFEVLAWARRFSRGLGGARIVSKILAGARGRPKVTKSSQVTAGAHAAPRGPVRRSNGAGELGNGWIDLERIQNASVYPNRLRPHRVLV